MSDPLSVTGSVVGVVSLGIQVSQGLYDYISSVRGRDKDLNTAATQLSNLLQTFQALNSLIPRIQSLPSPDLKAIQALQQCVQESEAGVEELRLLLASLEDVPEKGLKGKMKNAGRLLAFGLRREDLTQMQTNVLALTSTAELALQVIHSDLGITHTKELAQLGSSINSQFLKTEGRLLTLEQNTNECGEQLRHTTAIVETTSSEIMTSIGSARQDISEGTSLIISQMQANVEALHTLLISQHQHTQSELEAIKTSQRNLTQNGGRLLQNPSALREACDIVSNVNNKLLEHPHPLQKSLLMSSCKCDFRHTKARNYTTKYFVSGDFQLYHQRHESSKHSPGCVFYKPQNRQGYGIQFTVRLRQTLSVLIDLSLSCTTGAGGCSINPQFRAKQLVNWSPAFDVVIDFITSLFSPTLLRDGNYEEHLALVERRLWELFEDGEASPCDIAGSRNGGTLIHIATGPDWVWGDLGVDIGIRSCHSRLVTTLIRMGVPCDEPDNQGRTALQRMVKYRDIGLGRLRTYTKYLPYSVAATVAQAYDIMPFFDLDEVDIVQLLQFCTKNLDLVNSLDLPPLITAISLQSMVALRSILHTSPQKILNLRGSCTVLHFASCWPAGLSLLLSVGADRLIDRKDKFGRTALDYAIALGCEETFQILLFHGANWHGIRADCPKRNWLTSFDYIGSLAKHLANKRKKLWDIAKQALSPKQLSQLDICGQFPDAKAALIIQLIRDKGSIIPPALDVPPDYEGIYISGNLYLEHFPIFYNAGFREIHTRSSQGLLPVCFIQPSLLSQYGEEKPQFSDDAICCLLNNSFLNQTVTYPLSRGFNTSATGWHCMAHKLAWFAYDAPGFWHPLLIKLTQTQLVDSCKCWCSSRGCLPITILMKQPFVPPIFAEWYTGVLGPYGMRKMLGEQISVEILTFLTFEALEMTHTCCTSYGRFRFGSHPSFLERFGRMVEEIQEEEQELGVRLEILVKEFSFEFENSKCSLQEFLCGYWRARMAEECVPDEGQMRALEQTGVLVNRSYKTPRSLRRLFGDDFSFQ